MACIKTQSISGKGNKGMYVDRLPKIYAAGIRSLQSDLRVTDCFNEYLDPKSVIDSTNKNMQYTMLKSLRVKACKDVRNAGTFTEGSKLINPPVMTKFQTVVEDLKSTVYKSYWDKQVGKKADLSYCIPSNLDINNTTFGKKTSTYDNLYDIVFPNKCLSPEKKLSSKSPGYQLQRNYCKTSYNPNDNGVNRNIDKSGRYVKCCLTDDRIYMGKSLKEPILSAQRSFQEKNSVELGTCSTPNKNIYCVPEGHTFGKTTPRDNNNVTGCLTYCEMNPERELFYKCLAHLNSLRKCLSKKFDGRFFQNFYLQLKYIDNTLCGWLPKEVIYRSCTTKYIHFTPSYIEPLLQMLKAVNDTSIEYKTFVNIINYREPLPLLPKVWDISPECIDFMTTYKAMIMPQTPSISYMAGIPSGRYFDRDYPLTPDGCCKADRSYLPQESDAKACLCPSIFTLLGVSHREMYTPRDPEQVKKVFQAAGENMDEHTFEVIWNNATNYHPKRLVSFETFRRAMNEYMGKIGEGILCKEDKKTSVIKI